MRARHGFPDQIHSGCSAGRRRVAVPHDPAPGRYGNARKRLAPSPIARHIVLSPVRIIAATRPEDRRPRFDRRGVASIPWAFGRSISCGLAAIVVVLAETGCNLARTWAASHPWPPPALSAAP